MDNSSIRRRLTVIAVLLCLAAGAGIYYKIHYLKFSLIPKGREAVWQIEGRIEFEGEGESPVRVSLASPSRYPGFRVLSMSELSGAAYSFRFSGSGDQRRAVWTSGPETGRQSVTFRMRIYDTTLARSAIKAPQPELGPEPFWESEEDRTVAEELSGKAAAGDPVSEQLVMRLIREVFGPESRAQILLPMPATPESRIELLIQLLRLRDIPARAVYGIQLIDQRTRGKLIPTLEVYYDGAWNGFDPEAGSPGFPDQYLALRRGDKSMLDVAGGYNSSVRFATARMTVPSSVLIAARSDSFGRTLASLSIYDLPLDSQRAFMRISLIPVGILLVVIIRNIIGIQTMGTFMPVLIAMAFLDTTLVPGLVSFLFIVIVGLFIRSYLEHLNLLLVPRIAAVVLVVITLMKIFSLISYEVGFMSGLSVTLFPLIIMAWTIERASILWEEDGMVTTLRQFCASLGSGILCYFVMDSRYVQHITFAFMEIDLIILAVILVLGSYTGYRLTELRRFKSLVTK